MSAVALELLFGVLDGSAPASAWSQYLSTCADPTDLVEVDLRGYELTGLTFRRCRLDRAQFSGCRAVGVDFSAAELNHACFRRADLSNAIFARVAGFEACFDQANLQNADLRWSDFRNASFGGVDLALVQLWKTDLRGAVFTPFAPSREQDFFRDEPEAGTKVSCSLSELLQQVSRQTGAIYHLSVPEPALKVSLSKTFMENPQEVLPLVLKQFGLSAIRRPRAAGAGAGDEIEISACID
ncbi:MAG: pentapeptide repeat-containing protein [Planctomycetota bacterium]